MAGIISYGAYIPIYRLSREEIGKVWGLGGGKGEKAIANYDEDSLTMGVEAAIDCLEGFDRHNVGGLYFASTTSPYMEKQSASIIAAVLDLRKDIITADFTNSLRAGTTAFSMAIDTVKAHSAKNILVVAADCRLPAPNSEFEPIFGDGATAFLIGDSGVAVNVEESYNTTSEFMDVWRTHNDIYPRTWEDRFVLTHGYLEIMENTTLSLMRKHDFKPEVFAKVIFSAPDARSHSAIVRKLGFNHQDQVQDPMFNVVGNTGTAFGSMMLASAIEEARKGERILFPIMVTDATAISFR